MTWRPKLAPGIDVRTLPLSPMHGFVLSRIDGASDVGAIARGTSLPVETVEALLRELAAAGAILADAEAATPAAAPDAPPEPTPETTPRADDEDAEEDSTDDAASATTHRQRFETQLKALAPDARAALAVEAVEPDLSALCFDPTAPVVTALLGNPRFGLPHARLAARHHHTAVGLEALAGRAAFGADAGVRRALLHNPQLPASLYRRLWTTRRLLEQYRTVISREVPEQTRRTAREVLRARFASGPSEEKVELIMKTEARCLAPLVGLPIDSKTTALLCTRTYASNLFIQNLARWSAAPPQLVAHLLRQDLVRRTPMLRTLLERHPNAPRGRG